MISLNQSYVLRASLITDFQYFMKLIEVSMYEKIFL